MYANTLPCGEDAIGPGWDQAAEPGVPEDPGPRPAWMSEEPESEVVFAGVRAMRGREDARTWVMVPYGDHCAMTNESVGIWRMAEEWRVTESCAPRAKLPLVRQFWRFRSLENARAVYWDIVRAILAWGPEGRKAELSESEEKREPVSVESSAVDE